MPKLPDTDKLGIGYELRSFSVLNYISVPFSLTAKEQEAGFGVRMAYFIPKELKTLNIMTTLTIGFRIPGTIDEPKELVQLSTLAEFAVEHLEAYVEGKLANLPDDFLSAVANLAVSTSRGVLIGKNFGTPYAGLLLPVIPTADIRPPLPLQVQPDEEELIPIAR